MKYHYSPAVFDTPEAPELNEGYYAVLLEEDAERQHNALRNCLLLAMRNAHRQRGSDWEHIIRYCTEAGCGPSPLRAEMETGTARCTCKDFPGADEFCTAHTAPSTFPQHNCRHGHPDRSCRECFPLKAADGCNHPEGARSLTNRCLICDTQVVEQD